jgi:ADP-ribosyl-[dinitrogen reductase] hydrolase
MLLGLHAGDSLGAPLEFGKPLPRGSWLRELTGGGELAWRPGQATDDTDLMLCVLHALPSRRAFDFDVLKRGLLGWFAGNPRDVGNTTKKGLLRLRENPAAFGTGAGGEGTETNGSLMRCAPLALLELPEGERREITRRQTELTHAHPRCVRCDLLLVETLRGLLAGESREAVHGRAVAEAGREDAPLAEALRRAPLLPWDELSTAGRAADTLASGFWALLRFEDAEEALVQVVNRGDDSDTCGAVAGALLGAHLGAGALPERWVGRLERRGEIEGKLGELG